MRYRMSVIYGHPVIAATRALRFADHVTERNGGSGDENELIVSTPAHAWRLNHGLQQNMHAVTKVSTVLKVAHKLYKT